MTRWLLRDHTNPGLNWKHMLTVLFVKVLQAPQGPCIETLHTCWCILWWRGWHSSCRTQEEVGRATRPTQKVPPQMRLSDHVDVKQIKRNDSQFDHPNTSQKMMPGFSKRYCQAWFTWNAPFEEKHGNTISHPQKIWRKVTFKKKWQALGLLGLLVWA